MDELVLTPGAEPGGVAVTVTLADESNAMYGGETATVVEEDAFSTTLPTAFPENSVNQTAPWGSSTTNRRGDELLVGMSNSVSCIVDGSKREILFAKCSLNQTSPDEESWIQ